jgi:DNA-directed RNA polymerase II subunit RPB1
MLTYASTTTPPLRPKRLRFCVLSAQEIRQMSVCQVVHPRLYYRGLPATGGLLDPLMGTVDRRHLCATCMNDARTCPGHSGHIELAFPVYHIGLVDTVVRCLRTVCFACSRVCLQSDEHVQLHDVSQRNRLTTLHNLVRMRRICPHCGLPRPTVARAPLGVRVEWAPEAGFESEEERRYCTSTFTARDALSILRNVPDDDVRLMGFSPSESHPMNMVVQNLVVPPPCTRPAVYSSEGSRSRGQNDLTNHLLEVLKRSQEVAVALQGVSWPEVEEVTPDVLEHVLRLQYEVYMLVNNKVRIPKPPGMGRNCSSVSGKSLNERLKGKEGRVRGNLMGKRVDFSARCVITPDAYFECDRVGVPESIAMGLTYPETVNTNNIETLTKRVHVGPVSVRGAQTVIHTDGNVTDLGKCKHRTGLMLRPGDVVERFLADDDVVVFNRQPSLHMHGMQAHRVRIMPGHTFRLSLVVAAPYNADFDGDEMNLHVPQSLAARAECAVLMGVAQNTLSAQANRPVMGIVQDSLVGLHLLTHRSVLLDHAHTCRMVGHLRHATRALPPPVVEYTVDGGRSWVRRWTGKRVVSLVIPAKVFVEHDAPYPQAADSAAWADDDALPVVVLGGLLVMGVLRKAHVGTGAGGIVDTICRECDGVACMRFFGDMQRMVHELLLQRGHHVGIHDVMLSPAGHAEVQTRLRMATRLCEEIQRDILQRSAEEAEVGERAIMRLLSKTLLQTGGIVNTHLSTTNAIRRMVTAGSKGSFINLSQIGAALGQQSLEGGRIAPSKGTRTLPCYAHDDASLASRGMVHNSFSLGLSPPELFFHAIGGREGLVDTAVKTSQSGYISRRMNKSMEDNVVRENGIVCNSMGDVVSFRWGSDGFHPSRVERVVLRELDESEDDVRARMDAPEAALVLEAVREIRRVKRHLLVCEYDRRVLLPYSMARIRRRLQRLRWQDVEKETDAAPRVQRVRRLCDTYPQWVVRASLPSLFNRRTMRTVPADALDTVLEEVESALARARATDFENVGCIAAQSIGEPCTQMTLNTFHHSGVAVKNVTLGIPRLKELLDASKHARTPCTTLRFVPAFATCTFASYMAQTLPLTRLQDVVQQCDIVASATDDDDECALFGDESPIDVSRFVIRLTLAQDTMRQRHLTPTTLRTVLRERLRDRASVTSSETNTVTWDVRIRLHHVRRMVEYGGIAEDQEAIICHRVLNVLLETVVVSGCPHVTGANEACDERGEHVVHVYGSALLDCVASECVDWTRCTSNDVWDTYHLLGIEAAANVLFEQLKAVVSFDGTYVDDRHMMLIVDSICRDGTIRAQNRHGMNKVYHTSPLMRCSFEETTDVLSDAALFAQHENARGISASIMTGQLANMGTGAVRVLFPQAPPPRITQSTPLRVLRSTCRSYTARLDAEAVEYIPEGCKPSATRPLSPPTHKDRKRCRFRVVSPER